MIQINTHHIIQSTFCLICVILFSLCTVGEAHSKRVVFFTPTSKNNTYWPQVYEVVNKVADDLDMQIEIYEFNVGDRFAKHVEGTKILQRQPTPDGAVFSVAFGNSKPLLDVAEALHIPVFIQGPLFPKELPLLGNKPRSLYSQWIGYFYQDEFQKGYLLAQTLLRKAHARHLQSGKNDLLYVAGIGGDRTWFGSKLRQEGLLKAILEDPDAEMLQVIPTKWTEDEATQKTLMLLRRYEKIDVIWAASDQLGIGVAHAVAKKHADEETKALTGGLDLSINGLNHVKDGVLTATVASSMLQYAEIFIYLYDYLHGIDFADERTTELSAPLHVATKENAEQYLQLVRQLSTIDFRPYSKHLNPELKKYDFSVERLMNKSSVRYQ